MDLYLEGSVIRMDDFREVAVNGAEVRGIRRGSQNKGNLEALRAFGEASRKGEAPLPLDDPFQTTEVSIDVEEML